jgi:hypothetical protein
MPDQIQRRKQIQGKLEEVQSRFLRLLAKIPDDHLERAWFGEGWTIKEELVHVVQVVEVMPSVIEQAIMGRKRSFLSFIPSGFRGWVNGNLIIPRKTKNATRESITAAYQDAHKVLINKLDEVKENDWGKGMPYPRKYRTVEQLAYRPIEHFEEHEAHIRQLLAKENERDEDANI